MKFTRDELLQSADSFDVTLVEKMGEALLEAVQAQYIIWEFHKAPKYFRDLCNCNGGDEDWLVLSAVDSAAAWLDRIDVGGAPDEYALNGVTIYVGSHS